MTLPVERRGARSNKADRLLLMLVKFERSTNHDDTPTFSVFVLAVYHEGFRPDHNREFLSPALLQGRILIQRRGS